jgi:hypothetical protein
MFFHLAMQYSNILCSMVYNTVHAGFCYPRPLMGAKFNSKTGLWKSFSCFWVNSFAFGFKVSKHLVRESKTNVLKKSNICFHVIKYLFLQSDNFFFFWLSEIQKRPRARYATMQYKSSNPIYYRKQSPVTILLHFSFFNKGDHYYYTILR